MIEPTSVDLSIFTALNGDCGSALNFLMYYASARLTWVPFYGFLLWLVWKRIGWRGLGVFAVVCAMLVLCADQTANLFKEYMPKFRPSHYEPLDSTIHTVYGYRGGLYGTVSSHAANAMALTMLVGLTVGRAWLWWVMGFWTLLMCYSRIYLGVHFPFDIAFGLLQGAFWGVVWWLIVRKLLSLPIFSKTNFQV